MTLSWLDRLAPGPVWWATAALFMALFAATLVVLAIDRRRIERESVWAKPLKFELSLALHFATLAWAIDAVEPGVRDNGWMRGLAVVSVAAALFEVAYIGWQAGRGQRSHFNVSTPFHQAMYGAMAIGAIVIVIASLGVGLAVAGRATTDVAPALQHAITLGLVGGSILTLVTALRMGGRLDRHVGVEPADGARLPLFGWSLAVGDLRVAHFFATHMMQALPLFGLLVVHFVSPTVAVAAVWLAAIGWTALTLALFTRALSGRGLAANAAPL